MIIPSLILFFLFLLFGTFFSSSETVFAALHRPAISYLIDNNKINIDFLLGDPLFAPESVPIEKEILMIQERATHMIFVVDEFGRMPQDGEQLDHKGHTFTVAKMKKRHIDSIRIAVSPSPGGSDSETHRKE